MRWDGVVIGVVRCDNVVICDVGWDDVVIGDVYYVTMAHKALQINQINWKRKSSNFDGKFTNFEHT